MANRDGREEIRTWTEVLSRIHGRKEAALGGASVAEGGEEIASPDPEEDSSLHGKWARAFQGYERMLDLHGKLVSELLSPGRETAPPSSRPEGIEPRLPALPQREITVLCPQGGRSGARFGLIGSREHPHAILVPGWFREGGTGRDVRVGLEAEPPSLALGEGETGRIRVGIALSGSDARSGETLEGFLDVRGSGGPILRIWIRVEVIPAEDAETHG